MPVASSECLEEPARRSFAAFTYEIRMLIMLRPIIHVIYIICIYIVQSDDFTHIQSGLY